MFAAPRIRVLKTDYLVETNGLPVSRDSRGKAAVGEVRATASQDYFVSSDCEHADAPGMV